MNLARTANLLLIFLSTIFTWQCGTSLHLTGTWNTDSFYKFLTKFGVQKTDSKKVENTQGFIYGNITSKQNFSRPFTFVLVDSEYFREFYGNRTMNIKSKACEVMFHKINNIAFDGVCKPHGAEDILRHIPCPTDKLCVDEDEPVNVISNYQFTYKIQDPKYPRFWYISMVSCYRNTTNHNCSWVHNEEPMEIDYDIWFVNGHPDSKHWNPFEHQFSFEEFDVLEIYATFFILYIITIPIWLYAYSKQKHPITKLFTATIILEFIGVTLNFFHVVVFAINGSGVYFISVLGNAIDTLSQCLFMLILLLIAKGWTITHMQLVGGGIVFSIWGFYLLLNCVLFVWNLTEVDVISNIDEWQTWPGYLILGFRMFIMLWFVIELRRTFKLNKHPNRLQFFQQFGAFFLVWFIYIPVLAVISTQFSALWKHKTILTITSAGDLLSYCVMIHLLWPSRSVLYLIKNDEVSIPYELEITGLLDDLEETEIFSKPSLNGKSKNTELNHNEKTVHNKQNGTDSSHKRLQNGSATRNGYKKLLLDIEEES